MNVNVLDRGRDLVDVRIRKAMKIREEMPKIISKEEKRTEDSGVHLDILKSQFIT